MVTALVEMKNVQKWFGKVHALKSVDFSVKHSEIVALVGDNGAGKSTLIKILTGVLSQDKGEIYFNGKKVKFSSPEKSKRQRD